jgi:hypothetical protein
MVFRQCLAQADRKNQLAVSQMADDLAGAPLARRRRLIYSFCTECVEQLFELRRRGCDHLQRVAISQMRGVWIRHRQDSE